MNIKTTIVATTLLSALSFGAFAADSISSDQAQSRQSVGVVSISQNAGSPMDMRQALNGKAEEQGATAYRVVEARTGDTWHATAELYK